MDAADPTGASTRQRSAARPGRDDPDIQAVDPGRVPGRHRDGDLRGDAAERRQVGHDPQDPERDDAGPRRGVVADDHPIQPADRAGRPHGVERRPPVAAVDDLDRHVGGDEPLDVGVGHRRRAAVDVADDVRSRLEDRVRPDRARPRDRRAAGMERDGHPVALRPGDHRGGLRPGLDGPEPDLPDQAHAGRGHLGEVVLLEAELQDRGAGVDLDAGRAGVRVALRRDDRERLQPDDVLRPAREVDLAGRDRRRHAAVEAGFDEVDRPLARREVAEDRDGRGSR